MKKFKKVLPVLLCLFMLVGCGTTATNDEVAVETEAPVETNDNELVLGFGYNQMVGLTRFVEVDIMEHHYSSLLCLKEMLI